MRRLVGAMLAIFCVCSAPASAAIVVTLKDNAGHFIRYYDGRVTTNFGYTDPYTETRQATNGALNINGPMVYFGGSNQFQLNPPSDFPGLTDTISYSGFITAFATLANAPVYDNIYRSVVDGFIEVSFNMIYIKLVDSGPGTPILNNIVGFDQQAFYFQATSIAFGTATPEPSTWAMMLVGFAGLSYASYRKRKADKVAI
jgi:hypothetical protein